MLQTKHFVPKVWGYEEYLMEGNGMYFGKKLFIAAGHATSWHYHKTKDEVFYVLSGNLVIRWSEEDLVIESNPPAVRFYNSNSVLLRPTQSFRMKPNIRHTLRPCGESCDGVILIEFSNQYVDDSDTVRLVNGY